MKIILPTVTMAGLINALEGQVSYYNGPVDKSSNGPQGAAKLYLEGISEGYNEEYETDGDYDYNDVMMFNEGPTPRRYKKRKQNTAKLLRENACGSCKTLMSKTSNDQGSCITSDNGFTTISVTPNHKQCNKSPEQTTHAQMDECRPQDKHQCFYYNENKQQIFDIDGFCLTLLAPNKKDFDGDCTLKENRACAKDNSNPNFGGIVYRLPCDVRGPVWQRWSFDEGVIRSGCGHGYVIVDSSPFLKVANQNHLDNSFVLDFGESYFTIEAKFPINAPQIASAIIDEPETEMNIFTHGCWCSRLGGAIDHIGGNPVDELDIICHDWANARKCVTIEGGSCHKQVIDHGVTYSILKKYNTCPFNLQYWNPKSNKPQPNKYDIFSCGDVPNHINPSEFGGENGCLKDLCIIDKSYTYRIQNFIQNNPKWKPSTDQEFNKCTPAPPPKVISLSDMGNSIADSLNNRLSEASSLLQVSDETQEVKIPAPRKLCIGQAPDVVIFREDDKIVDHIIEMSVH
jgi:hypothetical protein